MFRILRQEAQLTHLLIEGYDWIEGSLRKWDPRVPLAMNGERRNNFQAVKSEKVTLFLTLAESSSSSQRR